MNISTLKPPRKGRIFADFHPTFELSRQKLRTFRTTRPPELHNTGSWGAVHKTRGWLDHRGLNHRQSTTPLSEDPAQNWQPWVNSTNSLRNSPAVCETQEKYILTFILIQFVINNPQKYVKSSKITLWTVSAILPSSPTCTCQLDWVTSRFRIFRNAWPPFPAKVFPTLAANCIHPHPENLPKVIPTPYPENPHSPKEGVTSKISKNQQNQPTNLHKTIKIWHCEHFLYIYTVNIFDIA